MLVAATMVLGAFDCQAISAEPMAVDGHEIRFDVHLDGQPVGHHVVQFKRNGGDLVVESEFALEVRLLVFSSYSYKYQSRTHWRDGDLQRLVAIVNDDGEVSEVTAVREAERLRISGPNGDVVVAGSIFPTDHWHPGVLDQSKVLNTISGTVDAVRIEPISMETVETEVGTVMATRYAYSGELENEVLYDEQGRWVGMEFQSRNGSSIEYVCRLCQGGGSAVSPS